jgi:hypothetical protein
MKLPTPSHQSPISIRPNPKMLPPSSEPMATTTTLMSLPPELHLMFFDCLDPTSAACFAVTTRNLYALYKHLHTRAQLYDFCVCPVRNYDGGDYGLYLYQLLEKWMGPTLTFDDRSRKFLSPGLYLLSKRKRWKESLETTVNAELSLLMARLVTQEKAIVKAGGEYVRGIWAPRKIRSKVTSA